MVKLEDMKPGMQLVGLGPSAAVVPIGEGSVEVFDHTPDGTAKERPLGRTDARRTPVNGLPAQIEPCCFVDGIRESGSCELLARFRHWSPDGGSI